MNEYPLNPALAEAILALKSTENNIASWLLGGSCGLLLQGVSLEKEPQDIDIYADKRETVSLQQAWKEWSIDQPEWNETAMYRSLLSHYRLGTSVAELVGDFYVQTSWCSYTIRIKDGLDKHAVDWMYAGQHLKLMPLAHELVFNILRARDDRIKPIARTMEQEPERHRKAIPFVLSNCEPQGELISKLKQLIPQCMRGIEE